MTMPGARPSRRTTTAYVYSPDGSRLKQTVPDKNDGLQTTLYLGPPGAWTGRGLAEVPVSGHLSDGLGAA